MQNRGPDDRGIYEEPECLLGQRRLAILDLSPAGHQPMRSPDGRYALVYNGEVYNFLDLRRELEAGGQQFSTRTDTEVVLALYAKEGPACLNRFRGMFAIAIWDRVERSLFLARDRMGIKPLYVWRRPEGVAFASEVKALRALPGGPSGIEPEAVVQYLAWGHVPAPITITPGVESMLPGTWSRWRAATATTRRYWDFPAGDDEAGARSGGYVYRTRAEAVEALGPVLREAVAYRCISDAPLGAFLSGGIDSSSVVSLMRAAGQDHLHTVSISFPQTAHDEGPYALRVAEQFGTAHTDISVSAQAAEDDLTGFFAAMDQPTCDGFNTYVVSKHARRLGLTVSMSGIGGDELFAGYPHYRRIMKAERWLRRLPRPATTAGANAGARLRPRLARLEALALEGPTLERLYYGARGLFSPSEIRALVSPDLLAQSSLERSDGSTLLPRCSSGQGSDGAPRRSLFHSIAELEIRRYMHNQLLRDSDVFGLAQSLEIRVPLIDHLVVETVFQADPAAVLGSSRGGAPKALLIESLPSTLPDACTNRPKMGFTFPFPEWLRTTWGTAGEQGGLGGGESASVGMLRSAAVGAIWERYRRGQIHWSRPWALHVLAALTGPARGGF